MLVLVVIYGIAPKIQEEKRPLLYIGAGITFILVVINIAIGIYMKDKYCKKNEIEAKENSKEEVSMAHFFCNCYWSLGFQSLSKISRLGKNN